MKNTFFGFLAGATISGVITWYCTRHYYNKLRDEEAESFVEKLRELKKEESAPEEESDEDETPSDKKKKNDELIDNLLEGAKKIQEEHQYKNYSDVDKKDDDNESSDTGEKKDDFKKKVDIEIITQEQWDNDEEYNKCGINVYTGGFETVFTDDADQKMSDGYLSETIGIDIRDQIMDSEDNEDMYVRNHKNKTDYEIIFDLASWEQAHNID